MPDGREAPELLDDWDGEAPTPRRPARWVGPLALLAVAGIVVAVVLGGTDHRSTSPVTPSPTPSTTASPSASVVASSVTSAQTSVVVPLPSIAGNNPADPLLITLLDPTSTSPGPGLVAYRVQVCAQSGGVASATVRVAAANWRLATTADLASTQPGVPDLQPQFPADAELHKGECASGYVTFAWNIVESPAVILYSDGRFSWYWRLT